MRSKLASLVCRIWSYSSLLSTQSVPYFYFDPDNEAMNPGFTSLSIRLLLVLVMDLA